MNKKEILARWIPAVRRYRCNYCGEDHTTARKMVEHMDLIHRWHAEYNAIDDVITKG